MDLEDWTRLGTLRLGPAKSLPVEVEIGIGIGMGEVKTRSGIMDPLSRTEVPLLDRFSASPLPVPLLHIRKFRVCYSLMTLNGHQRELGSMVTNRSLEFSQPGQIERDQPEAKDEEEVDTMVAATFIPDLEEVLADELVQQTASAPGLPAQSAPGLRGPWRRTSWTRRPSIRGRDGPFPP